MKNCFLDFETNKAGDFYLAGFSYGEETKQVVLNESLRGLATHRGLGIQSPKEFARQILKQCLDNNLTLVAYSVAEAKTLLKLIDAPQTSSFKSIPYLNLKSAAKKWCNREYYDEIRALPPITRDEFTGSMWSLASVMRLTDFLPEGDYNIGKTTKRFNDVIAGLNVHQQDYSRLQRVQKAKATKALKHNRFDVDAMLVLLSIIECECPDILTLPQVLSDIGSLRG